MNSLSCHSTLRILHVLTASIAVFTAGMGAMSCGAITNPDSSIVLGFRQHADHSGYAQLPFGKDDVSYLAAYERHEDDVFWQLGCAFTPEVSATSYVGRAESVWTPQLHLMFENRLFWGGIGLLKSRVTGDPSLWTGFYWQLTAGLHWRMSGQWNLRAAGLYVFDDWEHLSDFSTDELELGLFVAYSF